MLTLQKLGAKVKPDGFSEPYTVTMALATALYGFLGLWFSFRLACLYTQERWAWLATLGIWFASSLPVYMYFNPSWAHAHSVFIVAAFLWYWLRTRPGRTLAQWVILGLISGLVLDVYYANVAVLLAPLLESLEGYWRALRQAPGAGYQVLEAREQVRGDGEQVALRKRQIANRESPITNDDNNQLQIADGKSEITNAQSRIQNSKSKIQKLSFLFAANLLYCCATLVAFFPTLITRKIIYGRPLAFGYENVPRWRWASPYLGSTLFSSDHGLLLWTPILILAVAGLFLFLKRNRTVAAYFIIVLVVFCYLLGGNPNWDGISSFGNRFFISLTPLFVLGLAVLFSELASLLKRDWAALALASSVTGLFVIWNFAFIFQWGMHMIPVRGPISWKQMVHNQILVVPGRALADVKAYANNRAALMQQIEKEDVRQLNERRSVDRSQ
jgi:hypothetical protein